MKMSVQETDNKCLSRRLSLDDPNGEFDFNTFLDNKSKEAFFSI